MPPTDTSGATVVPSIALWKARAFYLLWWLWCKVSSLKAKALSGVEWNFLSPCFSTHQEVLFSERWAVSCCPAVKWILPSGPRLPTDRQPLCLFTAVKWTSGVTNTNTHTSTHGNINEGKKLGKSGFWLWEAVNQRSTGMDWCYQLLQIGWIWAFKDLWWI